MAIRMKMKQEKIRKIGIASALGLVVLVILGGKSMVFGA